MKRAITNLIFTLILLGLVALGVWFTIDSYKSGSYFYCAIGMLGVLLFGLPVIALFLPQSKKKEKLAPKIAQIPLPGTKKDLMALARKLTDDKPLLATIQESLDNTASFYSDKAETEQDGHQDYAELWLDMKDDLKSLRSFGMLLQLEQAGVICRSDWKESPDDFLWKLSRLESTKRFHLPIDEAIIVSAGDDIPHWCEQINRQWRPLGYQILFIDTESDEYWTAIIPDKAS